MKQQGFTLLELLIAIALMSVLSIVTTQALKRSTIQTKRITNDIDNINHLRAAMNIIKNDVSKAINYRDLNLFLYNEAQKERVKRYDSKIKKYVSDYNTKNSPNPLLNASSLTDKQKEDMTKEIGERPKPFKEEKEVVYTHFVGDQEKFYFTSSSGVRFRSADKISDLTEVGYFLRTCKSRKIKGHSSKCLWRSISYNLDGEITKGGKESVLIENVKEAKFEYLSPISEDISRDSVDWVRSWDSLNEGDKRTGDAFPAAVSLSLEVEFFNKKKKVDKKKVKIERLTGVFQVDFLNNKPFERLKSTTTTTPGS